MFCAVWYRPNCHTALPHDTYFERVAEIPCWRFCFEFHLSSHPMPLRSITIWILRREKSRPNERCWHQRRTQTTSYIFSHINWNAEIFLWRRILIFNGFYKQINVCIYQILMFGLYRCIVKTLKSNAWIFILQIFSIFVSFYIRRYCRILCWPNCLQALREFWRQPFWDAPFLFPQQLWILFRWLLSHSSLSLKKIGLCTSQSFSHLDTVKSENVQFSYLTETFLPPLWIDQYENQEITSFKEAIFFNMTLKPQY